MKILFAYYNVDAAETRQKKKRILTVLEEDEAYGRLLPSLEQIQCDDSLLDVLKSVSFTLMAKQWI